MKTSAADLRASEKIQNLLIASSPDRNAAQHFRSLFLKCHPDAARALGAVDQGWVFLITVFSYSRFLSEEVIKRPDWILVVSAATDLHRSLSSDDYLRRLQTLDHDPNSVSPALYAMFRRQELLRILIRDVLGFASLAEITEELSSLADAILGHAYRKVWMEMVERHGVPLCIDRTNARSICECSIIALGKLGGRELNYSSDIDLMFVYSGAGETESSSITNKVFFTKLVTELTGRLSAYTAEGICYRVDLRLRPDGTLGEVCIPLDAATSYYEKRGRDWELQMLIKARVSAGGTQPGRSLLEGLEQQIYSSSLDFSSLESVSATRERIHEKLARKKSNDSVDVKLERGGIRDIEFLVQCLQRLHGGREPWVRHGGTLLALRRLRDKRFLSDPEYSRLASAYEFLRHLEHRLQFLDDRQTHSLSLREEDLQTLANKMPMREIGRAPTASKLLHQLNLHLEEVRETYERVIYSQEPLYLNQVPSEREGPHSDEDVLRESNTTNLLRSVGERAPTLARTLTARRVKAAPRSFELFLESMHASPKHLQMLEDNATLVQDTIELFENSPYFAERITGRPELLSIIANIRDHKHEPYLTEARGLADPGELRQFYHAEMFRIQAASICAGIPIFDTLEQTSDLAEAVIDSAYRLAHEQVLATHVFEALEPPAPNRLMVVALGRLGMREFDLGSDADLNFVLCDEDAMYLPFWTRVAEHMIGMLSSYTAQGNIFSVDTRLRPNGREGNLVQTVGVYKEYFATRAAAWEGITYMKARSIAGDSASATRFLHELQDVDWKRYGQGGRSRLDLRNMRARLEKEQGYAFPLKAGSGGYYDIDFVLMYLRLRSAGIFYKVLNTPERIDIVEQLGYLDRSDAQFLHDAASLYRAVDHGLRVYSGHAEGNLPQSESHLQALSELVQRWTPSSLHDAPLREKLIQIQRGTRDLFKRLFP